MIGQTVSHYRILEKLGEGGMGVVYKAEDTKLARTVALKFLSLSSIGGEEKKRFKGEAKAAAALNHPNIATVFAIDEAEDQMFILMIALWFTNGLRNGLSIKSWRKSPINTTNTRDKLLRRFESVKRFKSDAREVGQIMDDLYEPT